MIRQCVYTASAGFVWAEFVNPQVDTLHPLHADNADFRDFGDRDTLAKLGVFSIDRAAHRCLRALETCRQAQIDADYVEVGLDRKVIYRMVAAKVQRDGLVPDGCWVTSTGAYAAGCAAEDDEVTRWAAAMRASERYMIEIAGDEVVTAAFSLGA